MKNKEQIEKERKALRWAKAMRRVQAAEVNLAFAQMRLRAAKEHLAKVIKE